MCLTNGKVCTIYYKQLNYQTNKTLLFLSSYPVQCWENSLPCSGNIMLWRVWLCWRLSISFWTLFSPSGLRKVIRFSRCMLRFKGLARLQALLSSMLHPVTSSSLSVTLVWRDCASRSKASEPISLPLRFSFSKHLFTFNALARLQIPSFLMSFLTNAAFWVKC